jgi:hypothetical protein
MTAACRGDTDAIMVRLYWLARVTAFAVIGALALLKPAHSAVQQTVQIACFCVIGLTMLAWLVADLRRWHRAQVLPVMLGLMAIAGGTAAVTTGSGQSLVAFACIAASWAGTDTDLTASIAVATARGRVDLDRRGHRRSHVRHHSRVSAADRGVHHARPQPAGLPGAG